MDDLDDLEDMTKPELFDLAHQLGIRVFARSTKAELVQAIGQADPAEAETPRTDPALASMTRDQLSEMCAEAVDSHMSSRGYRRTGGEFTCSGIPITAQYMGRGQTRRIVSMRWAAGTEPRPESERDREGARRSALYWLAKHPEVGEVTVTLATVRAFSPTSFRVETSDLTTAAVA